MTKSAPTMYLKRPKGLTEGGKEKSKAPIHKQASVSKGLIFSTNEPVNHSLGVLELAINLLHSHFPRLFSEAEDLGDFRVKGSVQKSAVWHQVPRPILRRRDLGFYHPSGPSQSCLRQRQLAFGYISQPHITSSLIGILH